ncbi:MAG: DUF2079 domain-containing protein [Nitrospirae bacterium]|nr:DUF2079 domain-containing protein [Nitrospirota bacterium]
METSVGFRRAIHIIAIFSFAITAYFIFVVLMNLDSTLSVYSSGDTAVFVQNYYNFLHGRPFQTSIFIEESLNPYAYLNVLTWHSYFLTTFLFSPIYYLYPDLRFIFLIHIVFTYFFTAFFTYKIINRISQSNSELKALIAFSIFAPSGVLNNITSHLVPSTVGIPFILAAYYFLISEKKYLFIISAISICLIQDDFAFFTIFLCVYVFIFEKRLKSYIYIPFCFAVVYLFVWTLIAQPAIRYGIIPSSSSMLLFRLKNVLTSSFITNILLGSIRDRINTFFPVLVFTLSALTVHVSFKSSMRVKWTKIMGLLFLVPAAHWGYGVLSNAERHVTLLIGMFYLVLLLFIGNARFEAATDSLRRLSFLFLLLLSVCFFFNVSTLGPFPYTLCKYPGEIIKRYTGLNVCWKGFDCQDSVDSNRKFIKTIEEIPKDRSVVFGGNFSIDGFVINRNDIWYFPLYYDLADYLVIQKDAKESMNPPKTVEDIGYTKTQDRARRQTAAFTNESMPENMINVLVERLVNVNRTHRIVSNTRRVLVLEKIDRCKVYMPPTTSGLGWLINIPKILSKRWL